MARRTTISSRLAKAPRGAAHCPLRHPAAQRARNLAAAIMSPPDRAATACEAVQAELQAFLVDGERPDGLAAALWEHLAGCERCARALAHDRAMRRALERLRGAQRAPALLRERVKRLLGARGGQEAKGSGASQPGGRARRDGSGGGSRST